MMYDATANPPHWVLAGVVSYGARDITTGLPGVYTKMLKEYVDWIEKTMY